MEKTLSKKTITLSVLVLFFAFLAGYAVFVSKDLIFGIKIKNVNLEDGAVFNESVRSITGNARNAIHLTLNGREVSINQAGDFDETIALLPGYNILNIRAEDKFGYVDEKNYKLVYKIHEAENAF